MFAVNVEEVSVIDSPADNFDYFYSKFGFTYDEAYHEILLPLKTGSSTQFDDAVILHREIISSFDYVSDHPDNTDMWGYRVYYEYRYLSIVDSNSTAYPYVIQVRLISFGGVSITGYPYAFYHAETYDPLSPRIYRIPDDNLDSMGLSKVFGYVGVDNSNSDTGIWFLYNLGSMILESDILAPFRELQIFGYQFWGFLCVGFTIYLSFVLAKFFKGVIL